MSRRCQLTGKKANNAFAVSHSHRRTKKLQEANLQWKRVWWPEGNRWVKLRLSTKANNFPYSIACVLSCKIIVILFYSAACLLILST